MSSDFFADLEAELVRAARRRAAGARPRRRARPALAAMALLAVAIATTAVLAVPRDRDGASSADRGATTPAAARERVTLLNGTTAEGLGARAAELLRRAGYGEGRVESWRSQTVYRSRVAFLEEDAEAAAFAVADSLNAEIVRRARPAERQAAEGARLVVVLGVDLLELDEYSRVRP